MELRHDWWVLELRQAADGRGFPRVSAAACRAAMDYLESQEAEGNDVDSLCDAIAAEGRVLTIDDVDDLFTDHEDHEGFDHLGFHAAIVAWRDAAVAERDGVEVDDASPVH